jgi:hypothetical protein
LKYGGYRRLGGSIWAVRDYSNLRSFSVGLGTRTELVPIPPFEIASETSSPSSRANRWTNSSNSGVWMCLNVRRKAKRRSDLARPVRSITTIVIALTSQRTTATNPSAAKRVEQRFRHVSSYAGGDRRARCPSRRRRSPPRSPRWSSRRFAAQPCPQGTDSA